MSKEFEEEFFLPSGEFHFSRGRSWIWMGFEDVERHTPNERHVLRRMVLARPGIIFVEDDIQRPMKLVFDAPMLPNDFHQFARRLALRQRHIVDGCPGFAVDLAPLALHPSEHHETRQGRRIFRRRHDADPPPLETVMAGFRGFVELHNAPGVGLLEGLRRAGMKRTIVALQLERVMAADGNAARQP